LVKRRLWDIPLSHLMPSLGVIPCKYVVSFILPKTGVIGLLVSQDGIILLSFVVTQYWHVTDGRTELL